MDLVALAAQRGSMTLMFDSTFLAEADWTLAATTEVVSDTGAAGTTLDVLPGCEVLIETQRKRFAGGVYGEVRTLGGLMLGGGREVLRIPNPMLRGDTHSGWSVQVYLGDSPEPLTLFTLGDPVVEFGPSVQTMTVRGALILGGDAAGRIGRADWADRAVGALHAELELTVESDYAARAAAETYEAGALASTAGPDVIVGDLHAPNPSRRGTVGNISAYALGTTACNIGDMPIGWFPMTNDAPVITSNLYRLRNHQFEQLGLSWIKYGFSVGGGNLCNPGFPCVPMGEGLLPPGCSDVYSISTNAFQLNLGPRWSVNPATGFYTYPMQQTPVSTTIERLLQVHHDDLEPDFNLGARYFAEAHYLTPDDAGAGNQNNNASYREVVVVEDFPNVYRLEYATGSLTRRELPAIHAWKEVDSTVTLVNLDVPGDGRFVLGYRVIDLGNAQWRYEYAVQNLNSDRGGQSFRVPLPERVSVLAVGFHDIADHSGAPFDTTDWPFMVTSDAVEWATLPENVDPNANALRWGSLYNFRLTTDSPPRMDEVTLGLFKSGDAPTISAPALVPGERVWFSSAAPPDAAIDARQPFALDGSEIDGFNNVSLDCRSAAICANLSLNDFVLTQTGGGAAPLIIGWIPTGPLSVTVLFKDPIEPLAWNTLTTLFSADRVRLGYLPGDVNANGVADTADVASLRTRLTFNAASPVWSTDINRDNAFDAEDLIRLMDLLHGAASYDSYLNAALPPIP